MKKYILIAIISLLCMSFVTSSNPISKDGYFKGIKLCGRVQIVNYSPDIRAKIVSYDEDLNVKIVYSSPSRIGEWQIVTYDSDFRVQIVDYGEDIKIQFYPFPGVK